MTIVTLSSKGQFTIPVQARKELLSNKFLLEVEDGVIMLHPVKIEVMTPKQKQDDLQSISSLSEKSFTFWDNENDDVYQEYFNNRSAT